MMHATTRKTISRFRATASLDTSFVLKSNKTILVDQAVWTAAELIAAHTTRSMLDAHIGPKEWMCRALLALDTLGYAERSTDENGNLIFKSTPTLLTDARLKAGELHDRRHFFSDGQL
jgi:hypothetical protein